MKHYLLLFAALLLFLYGCKEASVEPDPVIRFNPFYPLSEGLSLTYSYQYSDSSGNVNGERWVSYGAPELKSGTAYISQFDSTSLDGDITTNYAFTRKTDRGVYYYVDTSGIASLIPDTLKPFASVDRELILFSFPLEEGKYWSAYKLIILNYSIISMEAEYKGITDVVLAGTNTTGQIETHTIDYSLSLTLPDTLMNTAFNAEFEGTMYLADSLGIVKYEGDEILLAFINNGTNSVADTTGTVVMEYLFSNNP
jgi:hypothetical protein